MPPSPAYSRAGAYAPAIATARSAHLGPSRVEAGRDLSYWAFAAQILVLVFLQKFAVPFGALSVSLPLVTLGAWLGFMIARNQLDVSLPRLAMAGLFFTAVIASQVFVTRPISLPSFLQLLVLYAPFVFVWKTPPETYKRLLNVFQNAMLVGAAMVFIQLAWQAAFGLGNSLSLEAVVPKGLLLGGYNYDAPIAWGRAFVRPNGLFFLEPSFVSSFLATALLIELAVFRRGWRVVFYAAALLGVVAATGVLLALLAVPLLLARSSVRVAVATTLAGLIAAGAAVATGAFGQLSGRFSELASPGSSGWQRLIAPLLQLRSVYEDPDKVLTGVGAGNSVETNVSLWPMVKVMVEYGAFAGLLFMAFMAVCMAKSANRPLAFGFFVIFNFTGGFLLAPVAVIQVLLLVCLLQPIEPRPEGTGAGRPGRAPTQVSAEQKRPRRVVMTPGAVVSSKDRVGAP